MKRRRAALMPEQTRNQTMAQATLGVYLCTSGPFLLLIQSHCYLGLRRAGCPCDDWRSVCPQHLLVLALARLTSKPFSSGPQAPDATCCTADGVRGWGGAAPGRVGRFTSPSRLGSDGLELD